MFEYLKNTIKSLVNIGVEAEDDRESVFVIRILNLISILSFAGLSISLFLIPSGAKIESYVLHFLNIISSICVLFLNKKRKFRLSKILIYVVAHTILLMRIILFDDINSGAELAFLPMVITVPMVFKSTKNRMAMIFLLLLYFVIAILSKGYNIEGLYLYNCIVMISVSFVGVYVILRRFKESKDELIRKNTELQEKNRIQEELITQNKLKTELLGILSHDLKGPALAFNKLSKKVSFLLKEERYTQLEKLGDYFETAGDKIFHDVDRLLNWTIAQKEDIIIRASELSPRELTRQIIDNLQVQITNSPVKFENNIPEKIAITSDKNILEIILRNLLINAHNNSPRTESVLIDTNKNNDEIIISIQNSGPAIDMSIVEQAKAGRYRKSKKGHGLGLGICFSLIKFIDGKLVFETDEGTGTVVKVVLPLLDEFR